MRGARIGIVSLLEMRQFAARGAFFLVDKDWPNRFGFSDNWWRRVRNALRMQDQRRRGIWRARRLLWPRWLLLRSRDRWRWRIARRQRRSRRRRLLHFFPRIGVRASIQQRFDDEPADANENGNDWLDRKSVV